MADRFHSISPIDYRYWDEEIARYLSEGAFIQYKLQVEFALIQTLAQLELCPPGVEKEVAQAITEITPDEVFEEEGKVKHDIRALVNCIRKRVSDKAKPFVHMTATSCDISDTANAARFREATMHVLVPRLLELQKVLIAIALREADSVQIGRTHGQHAVPITFGFAIGEYVARLGESIKKLQELADHLPGKFAGAVGAYNASSLLIDDPEEFEKEVLFRLKLRPASHSTQIVVPEPMMRLLSEVGIVGGVMANLSRDMRHLQRTEISEVEEEFSEEQVGSSTMPHKRNPIAFENIESLWKVLVGRLSTVYFDQVSEHQRDLTGSASQRTYGEIIGYASYMTKRLKETMEKLCINHENLKRNLELSKGAVLAEPLYILLAHFGYPDAHEKVRQLALKAKQEDKPLSEVVKQDEEIRPYLGKMTSEQRNIISHPAAYTGLAAQKARKVAEYWKNALGL